MGNFDEQFDRRLNRESWSFYGVGILVIFFRLYARARKLGTWNYQADDYLMILVAVLYTALIVSLNAIADGGGSNLYPPALEDTFTPVEIQDRIFGSKIVVISEQVMLNVIYTIKACMLLMYMRLTFGLSDHRMVRYLSAYVATGWFATELAFFLACRPFSGYWALPPPNPQCTTLENYAIVQGCFNISADVLMLFIPIPLIVRMRLPWRQKIVLVFIFSLGVFVVIAALMTKIFNLTDVYNPNYMLWYIREASVAVYVSNLPMIWPLLREWFPSLKYLSPGFRPSSCTRRGRKWTPSAGGGGGGRGGGGGGFGSGGLGTDRYTSRSSTLKGGMTTIHSSSFSSSGGGGGGGGGGGARQGMASIVTHESLVANLRRKGLSTDEDIEMAMAAHGLGMEKHAYDSSEEDLKFPPWSFKASTPQSDAFGHRWPLGGMQSPPRIMSRSASRADSFPESVDSSFRLLKMEHEAKETVLRGGIQVQTTVEVREETAPVPVSGGAVGGGHRAAMW